MNQNMNNENLVCNYNPSTGRFLSEDPIGFASGQLNQYIYVTNNPINYNDPLGLYDDFCDLYFDPNNLFDLLGIPSFLQSQAQSEVKDIITTTAVIATAPGLVAVSAVAAGGAINGAIIIAPSVTNYVLLNPVLSTNILMNGVDFVDSISGGLGGPTTGIPSLTPGGVVGAIIGKELENR
jgi:hypothetical protein